MLSARALLCRIWHVLAAVMHLGNIEFDKKRHGGHHEAVQILNMNTVACISRLLMVGAATDVELFRLLPLMLHVHVHVYRHGIKL